MLIDGFEFSIPYTGDTGALEGLFRLKNSNSNCIKEIYLSGPQTFSGSGRVTPEVDEAQFIGTVDKIHKAGLRVNLVMNSVCEGQEWYEPKVVSAKADFLKRMHEEHGLEGVTIANPIYIIEVKRCCPDLEIHASVLGDIDCIQRAVMYSEVGADVITPDASINRNLELLKEIKRVTNKKLKLMVNEGCLYKCPFRKFHFNYISHSSKEMGEYVEDYFFDNCVSKTMSDPSQIFKSGWIRPEDIEKYAEITGFFKIVGRMGAPSFIERATKAYLKQSWDGDLLDILSSSMHQFGLHTCAYVDNKGLDRYKLFEKVTSCNYQCSNCTYCHNLAEKLVQFNIITRGKLEDVNLKEASDQMAREGKTTLPWTEELAEAMRSSR